MHCCNSISLLNVYYIPLSLWVATLKNTIGMLTPKGRSEWLSVMIRLTFIGLFDCMTWWSANYELVLWCTRQRMFLLRSGLIRYCVGLWACNQLDIKIVQVKMIYNFGDFLFNMITELSLVMKDSIPTFALLLQYLYYIIKLNSCIGLASS